MSFRYLRIAISMLFGVGCLLLISLWVRSYWQADFLEQTGRNGSFEIGSCQGAVIIAKKLEPNGQFNPFRPADGHWSHKTAPPNRRRQQFATTCGFAWDDSGPDTRLIVPHWFLALILATFACAPTLNWHPRFGLRTLMIVATLLAVALACIFFWRH